MIKDIARQLLKETINLENNWLSGNPGYIMNNYSIKCEAYKYVIENNLEHTINNV